MDISESQRCSLGIADPRVLRRPHLWVITRGSGLADSARPNSARNFESIELILPPPDRPRTTLTPWLPGRCAEFRAAFQSILALVGMARNPISAGQRVYRNK